MHIWLQAMHLMCGSKKGFSANQFCRVLGVDFKSGWFLGHRIREAMSGHWRASARSAALVRIVEADENLCRRQGTQQAPIEVQPEERRRRSASGWCSRWLSAAAGRGRSTSPKSRQTLGPILRSTSIARRR